MILHIAYKTIWEHSLQSDKYSGDTLNSEGFIHCSTKDQVIEVADYIFKGIPNLVLLVIDEKLVIPTIKYEDPGNGKLYPHIYGPLNISAVTNVVDFPHQEDGSFKLPDLL
jgi:uncharacterized protein (DUF952 family)